MHGQFKFAKWMHKHDMSNFCWLLLGLMFAPWLHLHRALLLRAQGLRTWPHIAQNRPQPLCWLPAERLGTQHLVRASEQPSVCTPQVPCCADCLQRGWGPMGH